MTDNRYVLVSGSLFGIIALLQAMRAVLQLPVQVGTQAVPVWFSWLAVLGAGTLCLWAFRTARQSRR